MSTVMIRTKYGKLLTVNIKEQNEDFITGFDKFGTFTRVAMDDILTCEPLGAGL